MKQRGFTLVEMLVSLAIVGTLSAVVIARFTTFDSSILLKNAALDIAATLRQAQILSVSVQRSGAGADSFKRAYGVSFTPDAKEYTLYQFERNGADVFPQFAPPSPALAPNVLPPIMFNVALKISDICIKTNSATPICDSSAGVDITRLDVSFRRPEFKALFHVEGSSLIGINNPTNSSDGNIESVQIHLESIREPGNKYAVTVGLLGHISVQKVP